MGVQPLSTRETGLPEPPHESMTPGLPSMKFHAAAGEQFRAVLTQRVNAYFTDNNISKHLDWRMLVKFFGYLGLYFGTWAWLMTRASTAGEYLAGMLLLGLWATGIGLNIGHDAAHGGFSHRPWINTMAEQAFTAVGVHVYGWKILHNVIHHTYTNIPHFDGDLYTVPVIRLFDNKDRPAKPLHRFQHIYCFFLYSMSSLVWVLKKDYVHMVKKEHCGYRKPTPPLHEWVILFAGKLFHYTLVLLIPMLVTPWSFAVIIGGFVMMHMISGLTLTSIFAAGHLVDGVEIVDPDPARPGTIDESWTRHQMRTTANFSIDSSFFFWVAGGLNFQIEHHLFPKICHVHYRALAPIVQRTAAEFGVPYHAYPSFVSALASHRRFLQRYGAPAEEAAARTVTAA
jgi:linoleoyl-CoA desaturase